MNLDYNPQNGMFILRVPRGEADPNTLVKDFGLNFSQPASTLAEACLFTSEPYCAAAFAEHATPAAAEKMAWITTEVARSRAATCSRHFDTYDGHELWDFQKADLDYMLDRKHSLDADEPGLGKTDTAIVYANEIQAQRVLVICPASIRFQWIRAIIGIPDAASPGGWLKVPRSTMGKTYKVPDMTVYAITSAKGGVHPSAAWTIASYEMARHITKDGQGILPALRKGKYDLLIIDEAHYLKTAGSKRTRALFGGGYDPLYVDALAERADRIIALTGTPLPNRPREAYTLARNLDFGSIDWLSEDRFGERFNPVTHIEVDRVDPDTKRVVKVVVANEASGRHAELQNRLRAGFMTRHLKREVMKDLKYPVFDLVYVKEDAAVHAALKAESLLGIDPESLAGADAKVLGHIAEARRIMGEALAPHAAEYARTILDGGVEKLVLFYWHHSVGNILSHALRGFGLVKVDGNTSPLVKDALIQKFINDPACRIIAGNVMSLGTGTDGLQFVCGHAILAEASWVPGENTQCFDRLDRGGQTRTVQGDIIVAAGSFAERLLASSLRKLRVTNAALDRRV